ncbi:hypothetical protein AJ79_08591 [Helicocarpus griseus UAMH5409]|uniref:Glutathione S-transferase n=1 Tax=Helicocarpus griseus UAMH5409 TaxID=1447875 RepID=A0A2B7WRA5_9EURO|nr:hypothetical protein AJ79_08591 [Helicocarpus griseus UAMH5409]
MANIVRHPIATGRAKALVDKHSAEQPLKLYAGWFCPTNHPARTVQRTWIALEEKKIPYQYLEIDPYDKSPSFLALNPKGLVPTLGAPLPNNQGTKPLYESNILNEYLEEAYPTHTPHLLPKDPYERARARIWIDFVGARILPASRKLQTAKGSDEIQATRGELLKALKEFTAQMDAEGPFFGGKEISLVDIALVPWVARFFLVEKYKEGGLGVPKEGQGGQDEAVWGRWRKWEKAVLERESVRNTMSDEVQYEELAKQMWA